MKTFNKKPELALICFIAISSLLTSSCTTLQTKEVNTTRFSVITSNQTQAPTNAEKIKMNWLLIYPDSIASLTKQTKATGQSSEYLSAEQLRLINIDYIYRKQIALDSLEYNYAVEQIAKQLEGKLVDSYWSRDEDETKLFLITREDVLADEHDYIFRYGKLAGFVVSFVTLPIADRSVEDMVAVYSGDENVIPIDQLIEQYGGDMHAIGYSTEGFKIIANAHFSELLNKRQIQQLEAKLRELTGVMIEVRQTGKLIL